MKCLTCNQTELTGKQTKFCSRKCHNQHGNIKHQNYQLQQERGLKRKIELIRYKGGSCNVCGYKKNISGLVFHHNNPDIKEFQLSLRECSNNSIQTLLKEVEGCQLLCHICHNELHYPHLSDLL